MIREEYSYKDTAEYLNNRIDILITGFPRADERSNFFVEEWKNINIDKLQIQFDELTSTIICMGVLKDGGTIDYSGDITVCLPRLLKLLNMRKKYVLVDITSLHHVVIMYLCKILIKQEKPLGLYAAYVRPEKYAGNNEEFKETLTSKLVGVKAVPGFAKRERERQMLVSFVGFEGIRLTNIMENMNEIEKVVPIVAFPIGNPYWFNITMWNSREIIKDISIDVTVQKCFSESIFEAVQLLRDIIPSSEGIILAPLGTRPHSMAAAIYATENPNVKIIHDYAIEAENRTRGISDVIIYHLSSFIET